MRLLWIAIASQLWGCPSKTAEESPKPLPVEDGTRRPQSNTPKSDAPDWQKAFKHTVRFDAAKKALIVDVKIEPGFHAYTTGETIGKPMAVALEESSGYALAGDVQYPAGVTKDLPIGRSVIVEGEAAIVAPVEKKEGATTSQATGSFRWQVCTDESCDRPRTEAFTVDVPAS